MPSDNLLCSVPKFLSAAKSVGWASMVVIATTLGVSAVTVAAASPQLVPVASYTVGSPGASIRGAALSPDGQTLYVTGIQDKAIWKVETATGKVLAQAELASINPGAWGKAVAVDGEGRVWAPGTVPELYVFSGDLELQKKFDLEPFGLTDPEGVTVDPYERIYVTDRKGKVSIYRFTQDDNGDIAIDPSFAKAGAAPLGSDIRQPAFNPRLGVVVGDFGGDTLSYLWLSDGSIHPLAKLAATFHVAADEEGRTYVVHYDGEPGLTILAPSGETVAAFSKADLGVKTEVSGVAVSADGTLLVVLDQRPSEGPNVKVFRLQW